MQSCRVIQIDQGITHLPKDDPPILLLTECHELLDSRQYFLFWSDGVSCSNGNISFQDIADDRFARSRKEVRFVPVQREVGDRIPAVEAYQASNSLPLLLIREENCCHRVQDHRYSI